MTTLAQRPAPSKPAEAAVRATRAADGARDAALRTLAAQATTRYAGEQLRIAKGLVIALNHGATLQADGTARVKSQTASAIVYTVNGHCDCPDATHRTHGAPDGRCKHRWAKTLTVRAQALAATPETISTLSEQLYGPLDAAAAAQRTACGLPAARKDTAMTTVTTAPDEDDDASLEAALDEYNQMALAATQRPTAPAAPVTAGCPEAAFSLCIQGCIAGRQAQMTVRGATYQEFAANVGAVRGLLDAPVAPQAAPVSPAPSPRASAQPVSQPAPAPEEQRLCPVHGVPLHHNTKEGRSWWSHRQGEGWCKGK